MIIDVDDYIAHYGTPRHSGRYPWGSGGDDVGQRNKDFLNYVAGLKKQGMTEAEIAKGVGLESTTQLRAAKSIAKNAQKQADIAQAQRLKNTGMSNMAIGKEMGINESSVRSLLAPGQKDKVDILEATANMLQDQVDKKGFIDIGVGVEHHIGVSRTKLATAVALLEERGYTTHNNIKVEQLGTGHLTDMKILAPPGTTWKDVVQNKDKINQITDFSDDGGRTYRGLKPPTSIDSKRVAVRYAKEGGTAADGVIYVRPGVDDISLGSSRYAQVRIVVDGTHYLKGMAMYKDDLPDGVDLMFNTNKDDTGKKHDAMKKVSNDPENPFGASVSRQHGVMNIVNEEGNWEKWAKNLSSQFLSKQSPTLAKTQLDMTYEAKKNQLDEISRLTNPAVRKKLLQSLSDDADSSAVHLKAAALPNQASHVILPIDSLKETEVYAPNYRNGERVVLVRHPHGGVFEIPELTVNNRHPESKRLLSGATDAIGINSKVAEKLSGADFDGDAVLVIPNNHGKVKTAPTLEGLKNFDAKRDYPQYEGMPKMSARTKQVEMGSISNLITDMTIRGASTPELARAVRHSMVVIDAEKHNLNYRESARANGIAQLKAKYQSTPGSKSRGASTLISRAGSEIRVPDRKARLAGEGGPIDKATGKLVFVPTGEMKRDKHGNMVPKEIISKKLAETDNAHTLSSGTPIEKIYADHSNKLKALANEARKVMVNTRPNAYSPSARVAYSKEVGDLNAKLTIALRNAPLERQAQVLANAQVAAIRRAEPDMKPDEIKRLKSQVLTEMRTRTGAGKKRIEITASEWDAIQAGAISNDKLTKILDNADLDLIKQLATPKAALLMSSTKKARANSMLTLGYTQAEVAEALGVSVTTLKKGLSDG